MNTRDLCALVTGGASGLGHGVASRIVAEGGKAVMLDVQEAAGKSAAEALGANAGFVRCDVTREGEVDAAVAAAKEKMGGLNLVVNCAGIVGAGRVLGRDGPMSGEFFTRVVHINLIGSFLVDKAAASLMQHNTPNGEGERGLIIHTSSVAAFEGQIGQCAYSATKGAVMAMTLPMAREFARLGIRVMAIAPGIFQTPMVGGMRDDVQKSLEAQIPFPSRLGRPDEYAELVIAICRNVMLNGETIRLDGAIRMQPK